MNPPPSWWTVWGASLHKGLQLCFIFLCSIEKNEECIRFQYWNQWISIGLFQFQSPLYHPRLAVCIIMCAASCCISLVSVQIACIKYFTAEFNDYAAFFSNTVLSSGSSGMPEHNQIFWKHQSLSQWNAGRAVTWSLNPIVTFIPICQPTRCLVLYQWESSKILNLHIDHESKWFLDGFDWNVKVLDDTRWIFHQLSSLSILVVWYI